MACNSTKTAMKADISKIKVGIRIRKDYGDIAELAESIKQDGLISPVILRKTDGDRYKLLAGNRRLKACKMLKMSTIDAIIRK